MHLRRLTLQQFVRSNVSLDACHSKQTRRSWPSLKESFISTGVSEWRDGLRMCVCAGPLLTFLLILPLQSNTGGKILWRYFIQRYHNDEVFYMISATKSTKSGQIKGLTCQYYVNVLANLESQMQKKTCFGQWLWSWRGRSNQTLTRSLQFSSLLPFQLFCVWLIHVWL